MPAHTYAWLTSLHDRMLPELDRMPTGPEGAGYAQAWFSRLLTAFTQRNLTTPYQQRNPLVSTRNAIRERLGDEHPALEIIRFDEGTWQSINLVTHDRTEGRNVNQRFLTRHEEIVETGRGLLEERKAAELSVALGAVTGRRFIEVLDGKFEQISDWSVLFTGQRKHGGHAGTTFRFEIPTLVEAELVIRGWERLMELVQPARYSEHQLRKRFNGPVNASADRHLRDLVPARLPSAVSAPGASHGPARVRLRGDDALYLHLFRAVYATIAVHWFAPPRVNRITYMAEIQGHRQVLDAPTPELRRAYAASRHYDDYKIADLSGVNIDGRQGIKLDRLPGLRVISAFYREGETFNVDMDRPLATQVHRLHLPTPLYEDILDVDSTEVTSRPVEIIDFSPDCHHFSIPPEPQPSEATAPLSAPDHPEPPVEPMNTPSDTFPAVPLPKPAPHAPARRKNGKPAHYRCHAEDKARMDAARRQVKELSQPDYLHGILELAIEAGHAEQRVQQALAERDQAHQKVREVEASAEERIREALADRDQLRQRSEDMDRKLTELEQETNRVITGFKQDSKRLLTAQEQEIHRLNACLRAMPAAVDVFGIVGNILDLSMEAPAPLRDRLVKLGRNLLGGDVRSAAPAAAPTQEPAETAAEVPAAEEHPKTETPAAPEPAAGAPEATHTDEGVAGPSASPQESPRAARIPRPEASGGVTGEGKVHRAVVALTRHNDAQESNDTRWTVSETTIAKLTGAYRPSVRRYFEAHSAEIVAHNRKHRLGPHHNKGRAANGHKIENEVDMEIATSSEDTQATDAVS